MYKIMLIILLATLPVCTSAQTFEYTYNDNGNRVLRQIVPLKAMDQSDSIAQDSTQVIESFSQQSGNMLIEVYPNPVTSELRVSITNLPSEARGDIKVWDLQGGSVFKSSPPVQNNIVDLSGQPSGIYIMSVTINGKATEWKIVKE